MLTTWGNCFALVVVVQSLTTFPSCLTVWAAWCPAPVLCYWPVPTRLQLWVKWQLLCPWPWAGCHGGENTADSLGLCRALWPCCKQDKSWYTSTWGDATFPLIAYPCVRNWSHSPWHLQKLWFLLPDKGGIFRSSWHGNPINIHQNVHWWPSPWYCRSRENSREPIFENTRPHEASIAVRGDTKRKVHAQYGRCRMKSNDEVLGKAWSGWKLHQIYVNRDKKEAKEQKKCSSVKVLRWELAWSVWRMTVMMGGSGCLVGTVISSPGSWLHDP